MSIGIKAARARHGGVKYEMSVMLAYQEGAWRPAGILKELIAEENNGPTEKRNNMGNSEMAFFARLCRARRRSAGVKEKVGARKREGDVPGLKRRPRRECGNRASRAADQRLQCGAALGGGVGRRS